MLGHHLSSALRSLWRFRLMTAVNLLGLSIGLLCFIAALGAIEYFKAADNSLPNIDRVYAITQQTYLAGHSKPQTGVLPATSRPVARHLKTDDPNLVEVGHALQGSTTSSITIDGATHFVDITYVDQDFGKILDLPFVFGNSRDAFGQPRGAVLTEEAAQRLFGTSNDANNAPNPIGKIIQIKGINVPVTGVLAKLPQPSLFGKGTGNMLSGDIFVSMNVFDMLEATLPEDIAWQNVGDLVLVRLRPGVSIGEFDRALKSFGERHVPKRLRAVFGTVPVTQEYRTYIDMLMRSDQVGISITTIIGILGVLVLAIACFNYSNLAVAQASYRIKEVGMRRILGAGSGQILIQQALEGVILAAAALVIVLGGLLIAAPTLAAATDVDFVRLLFLRWSFWVNLVLGTFAIGLGGALYPTWMLTRITVVSAIQGGKTSRSSRLVSFILILLQFGAASLLLISVICISNQNSALRQTQKADRGVLVAVDISLSEGKIKLDDLRDALRDTPEIMSISAMGNNPWDGDVSDETMALEPSANARGIDTFSNTVDYDYFQTIDAKLLAGRDFSRAQGSDFYPRAQLTQDGSATPDANLIIDRTLAKAFGWTPEEAVGKILYKERRVSGHFMKIHIIGVVENKPLHLTGAGAMGNDYQLVPFEADRTLVRISENGLQTGLQAFDRAWSHLAPNTPLHRDFVDGLFQKAVSGYDDVTMMIVFLSVMAFLIAVMGLFGMATQVTIRRMHEIGVRKTLGASARQILQLLLWDFSKPIILANIIAWPLGYIAMNAYLNLFVQRITLTPAPFIESLIITVGVAWLAVGWQAVRAARVNPARILRYE